jgi:hypothetical protein
MKPNVLTWLIGHDTGTSSRAIVAWLERDWAEVAVNGFFDYPRDPGDLGRCIRLLDIEPSYRERIGEMAQVSPQWARLVSQWSEIEALYREERPSGHAPKCYSLMQKLIWGENNDRT